MKEGGCEHAKVFGLLIHARYHLHYCSPYSFIPSISRTFLFDSSLSGLFIRIISARGLLFWMGSKKGVCT